MSEQLSEGVSGSARDDDDAGTMVGDIRTLFALVPHQVDDELTLAKRELKAKGVSLGVGAGLFGAAAFLGFLALIALVVAAVMGLATVMPAWLAGLVLAAFLVLLLAVACFLGLRYVRKAWPFVPEEALEGLRQDWGVLREGADFDPSPPPQNDARGEQQVESAADSSGAHAQPGQRKKEATEPNDEELRRRIVARREHVLRLRDGLVKNGRDRMKLDKIKQQSEVFVFQMKRRWVAWGAALVSTVTSWRIFRNLRKR